MNSGEIRNEIEKWTTRLAELQSQGQQAGARKDELEGQRNDFILAAKALKDKQAQQQLDVLTADWQSADREERDLQIACQKCEQKLDELRKSLQAAQHQAKLDELRQRIEQKLSACARVETALAALTEALAEWNTTCLQAHAVASDLDGDVNSLFHTKKNLYKFIVSKLRGHFPGGEWPAIEHWRQDVGLAELEKHFWQGVGRKLGFDLDEKEAQKEEVQHAIVG